MITFYPFVCSSADFRQKATRGRETAQGNMEPESNELESDRENTRPIDDPLESRRSPQLISSGHGDNAIPVGEEWDDPLGHHPEPSSPLVHDPPSALSDDPDGAREENEAPTDQDNWISAGTLSRGSPPITVQSSSANDDEIDRIQEGHAQEEGSSRINDDGVMHQTEDIEQRICREKNDDGMIDDRNVSDGPPYEVHELGLREDEKEAQKKDGKKAPGGHEYREIFPHVADNDGGKNPTSGLMHSKFFHVEKDNEGSVSTHHNENGSAARRGITAPSGSIRRANADAKSHEDDKQAESDDFAEEKDFFAEEGSQKRKREERREHFQNLIARSFRAIASCYESANRTIRDVENSQVSLHGTHPLRGQYRKTKDIDEPVCPS